MEVKLYVVPGSHPCATVEAALRLKGVEYRRVDLLPALHWGFQRAMFGKRTVPGAVIDGQRVVGSRLILRALEGLRPDPPLIPADPALRDAVEGAERWGDEELQECARWTSVWAGVRRPDSLGSFVVDAKLPPAPQPLFTPLALTLFRVELRVGGGEARAREEIARLPSMLDRVDELIAAGTIGGERPNVADLQIGASVRLLMTLEDLREGMAARPSGALAERLFPRYPGSVPAGALPPELVPDLTPRTPAPAAA